MLIQTTEICPLLVPPIENATRRWVGERVDAGGDGSLSLPLARGSRQRQGPESRQHARSAVALKKAAFNAARCSRSELHSSLAVLWEDVSAVAASG